MKIGIFDSGIGGLSVLYEAMRTFPTEQFIYYADEVHVPYGEKTQEEIQGYVEAVVEFMLARHVKAIVIACNTATSVSVKALRERYDIPIIGMEPAVKKAIDLYGEKRVLVTATPITVKGAKMKMLVEKVDKHHLADLVALPGLVRFAEKEEFDPQTVSVYLKEALGERNWQDYSSLVLGCTHFNYFKDSFRQVLPEHVRFVDGNEGTVAQLGRKLKERGLQEELPQTVEYFFSGVPCNEKQLQQIDRLMARLKQMHDIC